MSQYSRTHCFSISNYLVLLHTLELFLPYQIMRKYYAFSMKYFVDITFLIPT